MTDTKYADVSEYQPDVGDVYPYKFLAIRSNDGTYLDKHFTQNLGWCEQACDTGKLLGFIVYFVWEPNWRDTLATFKRQIGKPHPQMAVMLDVESWGGRISGDQSTGINACARGVERWLVSHGVSKADAHKRVIGYANAGDFAALWPNRGDRSVVLANYSSNPDFPGKIAHQYANNENTPPFGPCDINSADGLSPEQFAAALGLASSGPKGAPKNPKPRTKPAPKRPTKRHHLSWAWWRHRAWHFRDMFRHLKGNRK